MSRAPKTTKPLPHQCCPNALRYLFTASFAGRWSWYIQDTANARIPSPHCPWCGVALPKTRARKLALVKP